MSREITIVKWIGIALGTYFLLVPLVLVILEHIFGLGIFPRR